MTRALCLLVLLAGCAAPIQATRDLPQPQTLDQVNQLLAGESVTVELSDGERVSFATEAVVSPYDVRFERRGEPYAVPVGDVARITYVRDQGSGVGVLLGVASGAAVAGLGAAVAANSEPGGYGQLVGVFVAVSGALMTIPAAVLGGALGQGVSPGDAVPLYIGPVERYLPQPAASEARP